MVSTADDLCDQHNYQVGDHVQVARCMVPNMNQPGGFAKITKINYVLESSSDAPSSSSSSASSSSAPRRISSVSVFYPVERRREKAVQLHFLTPSTTHTDEVKSREGLVGRCTLCPSLRKDCGACDWRAEEEDRKRRILEKEEEERRALEPPSLVIAAAPLRKSTLGLSGVDDESLGDIRRRKLDAAALRSKKERRDLRKIDRKKQRLDNITADTDTWRTDTLQRLGGADEPGKSGAATAEKKRQLSYAGISLRYKQVAASSDPNDFLSSSSESSSSSSSSSDSDSDCSDGNRASSSRRYSSSGGRVGPDDDIDGYDTDDMVDRSRQNAISNFSFIGDADLDDPPSPEDADSAPLDSLLSPHPPHADYDDNTSDAAAATDSTFDASSPTFKQPEGLRAANALPSDIVDKVSFLPLSSLEGLFNQRADELENEALPDARLELGKLLRDARIAREKPERVAVVEKEVETLKRRCAKDIINGGTDQLRAALKRLEDRREIKKYKATRLAGAFNAKSWRRMTELMGFKLDALDEAINSVFGKVKELQRELALALFEASVGLSQEDGDEGQGSSYEDDSQSDDSDFEEEKSSPSGGLFEPSDGMDVDGEVMSQFDPYETATIRREDNANDQRRKNTKKRPSSQERERKRKRLPATRSSNADRPEVTFSMGGGGCASSSSSGGGRRCASKCPRRSG